MNILSKNRRMLGLLFLVALFVAIVSGIQKLNEVFNPPDTDISGEPKYNFAMVAGTMWTNKVTLAVSEGKNYRGRIVNLLLAPKSFDPNHPKYTPVLGFRLKRLLPVGTRIKIGRFMQDNGIGSTRAVTATIYFDKTAGEIDSSDSLFMDNKFLNFETSTNWDCNPELVGRYVRQ